MNSESALDAKAYEVIFKWSGKEFIVTANASDSVFHLKERLAVLTNVLPQRQKIIGLKTRAGGMAIDSTSVSDLALKPGCKIMMMGTPEVVIQATNVAPPVPDATAPLPELANTFDIDERAEEEEVNVELKDAPEIKARLASRLASVKVKVLSPPREGKKCLVMDIDYTLFDLDSNAERPQELARPFLHEFLSICYQHYDLIIWSATGMNWVELKMKELGILNNPNYNLVCMLDCMSMVTVSTEKYGVFNCKPLSFIWSKFPTFYNSANTVMIDDLRRNYILNPQQGLVIRPFKKAHLTRDHDRELVGLANYFTAISSLVTFEELNHDKWEKYLSRHQRRRHRHDGEHIEGEAKEESKREKGKGRKDEEK
mmetsp:Transcript_34379/g.61978  ORF Transcript_34379/g.61978 Transcript_34379/m.61978 type:complete len:370 (-) Transcript_34379:798-1907(-)|eukprot:CAMPEP_0175076504 /NCGR_PEP_ID=MMETSP0052_2-20121109/22771_1 /TAXON_ID=51329 ORGANISM="Polytomella parva, Strain SAG 63-3" /NCGR_SAMPLE_ID=MMETSP0052_2 /ASSEMBLY_ACC=CAM_ASM_000194 /LENGTH=369 /DNA_ID=CAMNT_0016345665 /DNA_START=256 /DNA_END=1365 /DNA_ORIENTATION=+